MNDPRELLEYIRLSLPTRLLIICGEGGWIRFLREMDIRTRIYFRDIYDYVHSHNLEGVKVGKEGKIKIMIIRSHKNR